MEENSREVLSAPKIRFTNQRALILEIIHQNNLVLVCPRSIAPCGGSRNWV